MDVLLVAEDRGLQGIIRAFLKTEGYSVRHVTDPGQAITEARGGSLGLVVADAATVGDMVDFVGHLHDARAELPVLLIGGERPADGSLPAGSDAGWFAMPLKMDSFLAAVQMKVDFTPAATAELRGFRLDAETDYTFGGLVVESAAMRTVRNMVGHVAATPVSVLLTGEPGTGKRIIARVLHDFSPRKHLPFIPVECSGGADAESKLFGHGGGRSAFEEAGGGTVSLLNIEMLGAAAQAVLARMLSERAVTLQGDEDSRQFDARIVATCGAHPDQLVQSGRLNMDLYQQVKAIAIAVPSLHQRREDIRPLVKLIMRELMGRGSPLPEVDEAAYAVIEAYRWPGNMAELRDVVGKALASAGDGGRITVGCLPGHVR